MLQLKNITYFFILIFLLQFIYKDVYAQVPQIFVNFPIRYDLNLAFPQYGDALPIAADFKGDGTKVIAVGTSPRYSNEGIVRMYLIDINGNTLPGWPRFFNSTRIWASAAGDVNNDGKIELVITTFDSLYVLNFLGNNLPGFPVYLRYTPGYQPSPFALALYDLENNGQLNIIGGAGNKVVVYNSDGSIKSGWPRYLNLSLGYSGFTVGDLTGDGKAELITTSFCVNTSCDTNYIYAFDRNGNFLPGWPTISDSTYIVMDGSVVLKPDTNTVLNSLIYITSKKRTNLSLSRVTVYNTQGNIINRWYHRYDNFLSAVYTPLVADLNHDGTDEILVGVQNGNQFLYMLNGVLLPGWPQYGSNALHWQNMIGKITYENQLNVISPDQFGLTDTLGDARGFVYAYQYNGFQAHYWPLRPLGVAQGRSFSDINSDGSVELLVTGWNPRWAGDSSQATLNVYTIPGIPFNKYDFPWPMFGHDRYRTNQLGFVPPDEPIGIKPISTLIPGKFYLYQNYPNPFNPVTTIRFDISKAAPVKIIIYDILGREIAVPLNEKINPGIYEVEWNAENIPSGIYFYRIEIHSDKISVGSYFNAKKMILIK